MNRLRNWSLSHPIRWSDRAWWYCERRSWRLGVLLAALLQDTLVHLEHNDSKPQLRWQTDEHDARARGG